MSNIKNKETRKLIRKMHKEGWSNRAIGRELGVPESSIRYLLKQQGELHYEPEDVAFNAQIGFEERPKIKLTVNPKPDDYFMEKFVVGAVKKNPQKIAVIADTQCKPNEDLSYMSWIGNYLVEKRPDVIVHIGDHWDCPSLSSYDKGKKSFEGRRLKADIEAGNLGMELLMKEIRSVPDYYPRLVFCLGNHDQRLDRLSDEMPEFDGFVGTVNLPLKDMGWEVIPFLKPIDISGIFFVHYLANPFTGKPYGGNALNQLKTVGRSFVVGHKQCLDVAIRPTLDGKHQIGIINGACYPFDEDYKGFQGNNHWRGITMLHEVQDGFASPMFVSLDYLKNRYVS